jgi:hypothetical protein
MLPEVSIPKKGVEVFYAINKCEEAPIHNSSKNIYVL